MCDVRGRGRGSPERGMQVGVPVGVDRKQHGQALGERHDRGPLLEYAPTGCAGRRRPEAAWALLTLGGVAGVPPGRFTY